MKILKNTTKHIRDLIPIKIRRFIYKTGKFLGSEPLDIYPSMSGSFNTLKKLGYYPNNCIDIGAYKGEWTNIFKLIFPKTKILMIEAQKSKEPELKKTAKKYNGSVLYEIAQLAASFGKKSTFYEMETGSSFLPELTDFPRHSIEVTTNTLDNLIDKYVDFSNLDFLKLDTQGYEIEILKGSINLLKNTKIILIEASVIPYNENGPLISEVFNFLDKNGFQLFDFCSQLRKSNGVLIQTDLLFINKNSDLLPKL